MKTSVLAIFVGIFAIASTCAFAQDYGDNDTPMLTPAEVTQLRAERDAARSEWARMTPEQRIATKQTARQKRFADLTALDMIADNDTVGLSVAELKDLRAQMATAKAHWGSLSPEEKNVMRKCARQMKLAELSQVEKFAGSGS